MTDFIARSRSRVLPVREVTKSTYVSGFGSDTVFRHETVGWEIVLEGPNGAAHAVMLERKPSVVVGDHVLTTYEKEKLA